MKAFVVKTDDLEERCFSTLRKALKLGDNWAGHNMRVNRSSAEMYQFRYKIKRRINTIIVPVVLIMQIVMSVILLSGCGYDGTAYKKITQEEAVQIMQEQSDYLI